MNLIPHSKPWITGADVSSMVEVLDSGMIAQGEVTEEFERTMGDWVGAEQGVAVGSGAAALVLALLALGIGVDGEVVLPAYVCPTVLEAVLTTGATPVLCDVGPNWVVTADNMAKYITRNTKSLIVPHMYGIFADVESFRQFGIPIIEDCAQAVDYKGKRKVRGEIAMFSFHPTKCLTTGEGGMAVSANPDLVAVMRSIRDGTKKADSGRLFSPTSDISASLGLSQLSRYHAALDRRTDLALKYKSALEKVVPDSLQYAALENSMYFRFPIRIAGGVDAYQDLFAEKHISVRRGVDKLIHRLGNSSDSNFPMSVELYNTTISLPIYPALSDEEHSHCIESAIEILSKHPSVCEELYVSGPNY
jgi:UDP-4-amino-4-deoxy-L-arabinose-oxoglutarate aminotransferase